MSWLAAASPGTRRAGSAELQHEPTPVEIARDKRAQSTACNLSEGSRSEALSERSGAAPELAALPLNNTVAHPSPLPPSGGEGEVLAPLPRFDAGEGGAHGEAVGG